MSPGVSRRSGVAGKPRQSPRYPCRSHGAERPSQQEQPATRRYRTAGLGLWFCLLALVCAAVFATRLAAAEPVAPSPSTNSPPAPAPAAVSTNTAHAPSGFDVRSYVIKSDPRVFSNAPSPILVEYTGTNLRPERIVQAASQVLWEYQKRGYPKPQISIALDRITNGVVTLNVYQGAFPQVLLSGKPCFDSNDAATMAITAAGVRATNAIAAVKTNAVPRFTVRAYELHGDTLLSTETLMGILAKYTGTNIAVADIIKAANELQMEYQVRGFPTVKVSIPQQQITNQIVQLQVFEGRLSSIVVTGNRYFSSNNVMRALPSLHTNTILVGPIFQAELDRANANQDRQIYPQIEPGPEPNTSDLRLIVKDRLPLHGKIDVNDQNSPGTPDLRVNTSVAYNNLWQMDHSLGLQYGFSPELSKRGREWPAYDQPLVANYSGYYRLPLAAPTAVSEEIASQPANFGYSEATRKFNLPPPSGVPELNVYASRATIDTGLQTTDYKVITSETNQSVTTHTEQEDTTINQSLGLRLSLPLRQFEDIRSTFSAGFDYKNYDVRSEWTFAQNRERTRPGGPWFKLHRPRLPP
jgi:hemolysin activation/secretion protein